MKPAIFIAFACFVVLLSAASAQKKENEEQECCCSTHETGQCLNKVFAKVEGELNSTYQEALKRKGPGVKKLRIAQRSWLAYRAANCDAEAAEYEGGSIAPQIYGLCRIRLTRARIKEIRDGFIQEH